MTAQHTFNPADTLRQTAQNNGVNAEIAQTRQIDHGQLCERVAMRIQIAQLQEVSRPRQQEQKQEQRYTRSVATGQIEPIPFNPREEQERKQKPRLHL